MNHIQDQNTFVCQDTGYQLSKKQKCYKAFKAVLSFFAALVALILLAPLFLIVAIAIRMDSKGPVFFCQKRVGLHGKEFRCIKFRSMSVDAKHNMASYEYEGVESSITRVGAFIRKYSIDELPQLYNILLGQMSFIGYRPVIANETELCEAREKYHMYQIRPGLSGWAQVNGRDVLASQPSVKAQYDNYYLHHFSLRLDIRIFALTIVKVFGHCDVVEGTVPAATPVSARPVVSIGDEISSSDDSYRETGTIHPVKTK